MRGTNYIYICLGLLLMVFSAIKFYNQPLPPNSKILSKFYDYLHGIEFKNEDNSGWYNSVYEFNASQKKGSYFYTLESIRFNYQNTSFHFKVKPTRIKPGVSPDSLYLIDPFPNVVVKKTTPNFASAEYPLTSKQITVDSLGNMDALLFFPMMNRAHGNFMIWENFTSKSSDYNTLFKLVNSTKFERAKGTTVWGLLFVLGLLIFIKNLRANPGSQLRKQLLKEIGKIDQKREKILGKINWYRSTKEMPDNDKTRYKAAESLIDRSQNIIIDYYGNLSFFSNNPLEQVYKIFLILLVVALFSILVRTSVDMLFPSAQFAVEDVSVLPSSFLDNYAIDTRIIALERGKSGLTKLLFGVLTLGILSIMLNYFVSIWRVRYIAKQDIGSKLTTYNREFQGQLENKTTSIDKKLSSIEDKITKNEDSANGIMMNIVSATASMTYQQETTYRKAVRAMRTEAKRVAKQIKKSLKEDIKNINSSDMK